MRKQTGFDVISENIANAQEKQILLGRVQRYLDEGWEVLNTHVPQSGSGALTITVVLVKYEYDTESYEDAFGDVVTEKTKRSPGRPKKEEVEAVPA